MRTSSALYSLAIATALLVHPGHASAQAGDYFLNSRDPSNGFTVLLSPGFWHIVVADGAWSPWNYVEGCGATGANCHTGFHTIFYYALGNAPMAHWGVDGAEAETATHSDFYATADLAEAHRYGPLQIFVNKKTSFRAYIPDCCYYDNTGGMTISVARATPPVTAAPEPATMTLVATGIGSLGVWSRRRKAVRRARSA